MVAQEAKMKFERERRDIMRVDGLLQTLIKAIVEYVDAADEPVTATEIKVVCEALAARAEKFVKQ